MIGRREISLLATAGGVADIVQEKDYVLTLLLAARGTLGPSTFVFKGGTALRRCYFSDYRYSEDLDFTATLRADSGKLPEHLKSWCAFVHSEFGIDCQLQTLPADLSAPTLTAEISYRGPLGASRDIKFDVAQDEVVVTPIERRALIPTYSDAPEGIELEVYSLEEIWAEKTRSLAQRSEPRDLYDLDELIDADAGLAVAAYPCYERKMTSKRLRLTRLAERLDAAKGTFEYMWESRLGPHVKDLKPFEETWRAVRRSLRQAGYLD